MSEDALPVHVNRGELHALEVPDSFEADGSFDIVLVNHGQSVHIHLHLDDALSEAATIDASNHFVDGEAERAVRVHVNGVEPTRGKLKIASAYGAQTRYVDVQVSESEEPEQTVEVDESLSQPQPTNPESGDEGSRLGAIAENPEFVVLVLGVVALAIAGLVAALVDNVVVIFGAVAVLVGVLVAIYVVVTGG